MDTSTSYDFYHQINENHFHFFISIELLGNHATVNLEVTEPNKTAFEKLSNSSSILKELAIDKLNRLNNEPHGLKVTHIDTGSQWMGQFDLHTKKL